MEIYPYSLEVLANSAEMIFSWSGLTAGSILFCITSWMFVVDDSSLDFFKNFANQIKKKWRRVLFCFLFTFSVSIICSQYKIYTRIKSQVKIDKFNEESVRLFINKIETGKGKKSKVGNDRDGFIYVEILNENEQQILNPNFKICVGNSGVKESEWNCRELSLNYPINHSTEMCEIYSDRFFLPSGKFKGYVYLSSNKKPIKRYFYGEQ